MALSKSARLYLKISDSLSEEDVRNLRALVVHDRILGKSRVERATPLEIFNMLDDNMAIGEGNLGFLEHVLRSFGKGKLADEVRHFEQEQKTGGTSQSNRAETKKSVESTDHQDTQISLNRLHVELNTLAVKPDKDHQDWDRMLDLYCQIGDLYRTKLHLLQSALKYYQKMLECSKELSKDTKEAEAYNRIGLTYEMLGLHKEASTNHERALGILKARGRETETCAAYKTLASSLALSGQVSDAKTHYESALAAAMDTGNKTEQLDINSKLGDLHREQLHEPQESHSYYTEMLALAKDLGREDLEGHAYNRLGLACGDMQDNKSALKWHRKDLAMSLDAGDKTAQIAAHTNVGNAYRLLGKHDKATSHFNTALQLAQQTGDLHGQMDVYMKMGEMHREQLHFPHTAIQHYEQYLSIARQLLDRQQEGLAYNRLGLTHHEMGEYEEALKWYERALKMQEDDGDKGAQIVQHTNMGDTCRLLGQPDRARSHYQSAMAVAMETDNKQELKNIAKELASLD